MKLLFCILFSVVSQAKMIRVAVLDTGYFINESKFKECIGLERNFTVDKTMEDFSPHGQNIVNIITNDLQNVDYCVINVKIMTRAPFNYEKYEQALEYIVNLKPDIVNLSFEGATASEGETRIIKKGLDKGIRFIAAAGNDNSKLTNKKCKVYPACVDNRVEVVGSLTDKNTKSRFSNYGSKVKYWEHGEHVTAGGFTMSGTSQAAAIRTNRIIKELSK